MQTMISRMHRLARLLGAYPKPARLFFLVTLVFMALSAGTAVLLYPAERPGIGDVSIAYELSGDPENAGDDREPEKPRYPTISFSIRNDGHNTIRLAGMEMPAEIGIDKTPFLFFTLTTGPAAPEDSATGDRGGDLQLKISNIGWGGVTNLRGVIVLPALLAPSGRKEIRLENLDIPADSLWKKAASVKITLVRSQCPPTADASGEMPRDTTILPDLAVREITCDQQGASLPFFARKTALSVFNREGIVRAKSRHDGKACFSFMPGPDTKQKAAANPADTRPAAAPPLPADTTVIHKSLHVDAESGNIFWQGKDSRNSSLKRARLDEGLKPGHTVVYAIRMTATRSVLVQNGIIRVTTDSGGIIESKPFDTRIWVPRTVGDG